VAVGPPGCDLNTALLPDHHQPPQDQGQDCEAGAAAHRSPARREEPPALAAAVSGRTSSSCRPPPMPTPVLHAPSLDQLSYRLLNCQAGQAMAAAAAAAGTSPLNSGSSRWWPGAAWPDGPHGDWCPGATAAAHQPAAAACPTTAGSSLLPSTQQQPQPAAGSSVDVLCATAPASSSAVGTDPAPDLKPVILTTSASDSSHSSSWEQPFSLAADAGASAGRPACAKPFGRSSTSSARVEGLKVPQA